MQERLLRCHSWPFCFFLELEVHHLAVHMRLRLKLCAVDEHHRLCAAVEFDQCCHGSIAAVPSSFSTQSQCSFCLEEMEDFATIALPSPLHYSMHAWIRHHNRHYVHEFYIGRAQQQSCPQRALCYEWNMRGEGGGNQYSNYLIHYYDCQEICQRLLVLSSSLVAGMPQTYSMSSACKDRALAEVVAYE